MDLDKQTWVVGVHVRIKTHFGDVFEGEIFTFDTITNCVTLCIFNNASLLCRTTPTHHSHYQQPRTAEIYIGLNPLAMLFCTSNTFFTPLATHSLHLNFFYWKIITYKNLYAHVRGKYR
jgi:hypothetical protein